jgi:hypothetical protein
MVSSDFLPVLVAICCLTMCLPFLKFSQVTVKFMALQYSTGVVTGLSTAHLESR